MKNKTEKPETGRNIQNAMDGALFGRWNDNNDNKLHKTIKSYIWPTKFIRDAN